MLIPIESIVCWLIAINAYSHDYSYGQRWGIAIGFSVVAAITTIEASSGESYIPTWCRILIGFLLGANVAWSIILGGIGVAFSAGVFCMLTLAAFMPEEKNAPLVQLGPAIETIPNETA